MIILDLFSAVTIILKILKVIKFHHDKTKTSDMPHKDNPRSFSAPGIS